LLGIEGPSEYAGNPSELFTWFGKSDLPVATIFAPASSASQGQISGIGFAVANTIASVAIALTHSGFNVPGPGFDAATTMSAPFMAAA